MARAYPKDDANLYRVILNRHKTRIDKGHPDQRRVPTDEIENTWIEGPYGTVNAAKGRLTYQTGGYYPAAHSGKVQVIETPEWKDLP